MNKIAIYPGRFQPFTPNHYANYNLLCKKFGKNNVYICTSNKMLSKSPFSFILKRDIMTGLYGIPKSNIILVKNPYKPVLLLTRFNLNNTIAVFVVGKKDSDRLVKGKYFLLYDLKNLTKPYILHGYVYTSKHYSYKINGTLISGTSVRLFFGSDKISDLKKIAEFKKVFPKFIPELYLLIINRLAKKLKNLNTNMSDVMLLIRVSFFPIMTKQFLDLQKTRLKLLHYTNLKGLSRLFSLLGTKKPICTTSGIFYRLLTNGVSTSGGVVTILSGRPLFYYHADAYTYLDKGGRRWVSFSTLASKTEDRLSERLLSMLEDLLNNMLLQLAFAYRSRLLVLRPKFASIIMSDIAYSKDKKLRHDFITDYFKQVQTKFFAKHKDDLYSIFSHVGKKLGTQGLNLILLVDTKILKIGIDMVYNLLVYNIVRNMTNKKIVLPIYTLNLFKQFVLLKLLSMLFNLLQNSNLIELQALLHNCSTLLLTLGGNAGHMANVFLDMSLTFNDLKTIVNRSLYGKLNILKDVTIKTDGQNLFFSYKNGKVIASRNKSHIKNYGLNALDIQAIKKQFSGRGLILKAFVSAMTDLLNALLNISKKQLELIFQDGKRFMNILIIYTPTTNVILYNQNLLMFHNLVLVDQAGNAISVVLGYSTMLANLIKTVNSNLQNVFSITGPVVADIPKSRDFKLKRSYFINKINDLQRLFNLKGNDAVGLYHYANMSKFILNLLKKYSLSNNTELLQALAVRWTFNDKRNNIKSIYKLANNPHTVLWINKFDKKDKTNILKQSIWPFLCIFLLLGVLILKNISDMLVVDKSKAVLKIKKLIDYTIKNAKGLLILSKLDYHLNRLNAIGGLLSIVPTLGVVFVYNNKTYKLTGAFAPVNQILGLLKY